MKYYIIAGEASGDLHGSNLIKALKKKDPDADIWAWGGDLMADAGAKIRKHYRDLAFMGFVEVLKNLRTILRNMDFCKKDITEFAPDVIVFVDYPGFNLRIAKWARITFPQKKPHLVYYISPQIWAWHSSRVKGIKASIDKMLCILPFEKAFYEKFDVEVSYVGHPLLDVISDENDVKTSKNTEPVNLLIGGSISSNVKKIIALLPGSRRQEVEKILPEMLSVVPYFPDYQFVIAASQSLPMSFFEKIIDKKIGKNEGEKVIQIIQNQTYDVLKKATAALVKSGTSTLETALHGVPQVVCYKGSPVSYAIAKRVIQVKYISLVNLIADKKVVAELIQDDLNAENLRRELQKALDNQLIMKNEYKILRGLLGDTGASERAAEAIVSMVSK